MNQLAQIAVRRHPTGWLAHCESCDTRAAQTSRPAADLWAADHRPVCRPTRLQPNRRPR